MTRVTLSVVLVLGSVCSALAQDVKTEFVFLESRLEEAIALNEPDSIAFYNLELGKLFFSQGAYTRAITFFQTAAEHYQQAEDRKGIASVYLEQGKLAFYNKQPSKAKDYLLVSLEYFKEINDLKGQSQCFTELGHLYEKAGDYEQALAFQSNALKVLPENQSLDIKALILENLGSIYEDLAKYDSAFYYFRKARALNKTVGDSLLEAGLLNNHSDYFRKTAQYDSAIYYGNLSLQLAQRRNYTYRESSALRDLGKIYALLGQHDLAYEYNEKAREKYERIFAEESRQQVTLLQNLFELEAKTLRINNLEQGKKINRWITLSLGLSILLLLILAWVLFNRQRHRLRSKELLIEKNEAIHQQALENSKLEAERLKIELKHKKLEEEYLTLELNAQHKALSARMLQIIEKNKLLEDLRDQLNAARDEIPEKHQDKLKRLSNLIGLNFSVDEDWTQFQQSFEQIHSEFYTKLRERSPDLTSNDLRVCSLIRINLSSDQIASVLGITADSLRVSRYRLRKKLTLTKEQKLREFILSI
ncbi:MAG: tetratricopeptide repeat protein [Leptolyngbya sp. SIO3F4]|nr:tetratricopeptide repeat protein [Leptolyngbya sp. SIO3F4]